MPIAEAQPQPRRPRRRSADYTIQGFIYQFNKTLLEILKASPDDVITVEGIVEDIQLEGPTGDRAIQCKYHEAATGFTPSLIYRPILEMLEHFRCSGGMNIQYKLYVYVPRQQPGIQPFTSNQVQEVLNTNNADLKHLASSLKGNVDVDAFCGRFSLEFGVSLDELIREVCTVLKTCNLPPDDIETLFYPNAIQAIANRSIKHAVADRKMTKDGLLSELRDIRATAVSRWTLALRTRRMILAARRKQLKANLDINSRLRCFILSEDGIDDFDAQIVTFVGDYLRKYHHKWAHNQTPIFCLHCNEASFADICRRLYLRGIRAMSGLVGGEFFEEEFLRPPMVKGRPTSFEREFAIRILRAECSIATLNRARCEDLFIVTEKSYNELHLQDVRVERIAVSNWQELYYILGLSDVYE